MDQVSTADVAAYLRELNAVDDRLVEKILIRQVNPSCYACQTWYVGEREPESHYLILEE